MTTDRPLSSEERDSLLARRAALEKDLEANIADDKRASRGAAFAMVPFVALFAAICLFNMRAGVHLAALAAAGGVIVFGAIALWVSRSLPPSSWTTEIDAISEIDEALSESLVHVQDLVADAALVISLHDRPGEPIGDVLRMGNHVVYIRRSAIPRVARERLPNRHLRLVDARACGIIAAEALAEPIEAVIPVVLIDEDEILDLVAERVEVEADFEALTRTLQGTPRAPYR